MPDKIVAFGLAEGFANVKNTMFTHLFEPLKFKALKIILHTAE